MAAGRVGLHAELEQVLGRARDRVGGIVHVRDPVAVLVGGHAADHLAGRVDRRAAPGVAGRALDPDLHRARPRRSRSGRCARRAGWSGRCRFPPCRCRPAASTARRTAGRPSCTRTGSWTGSTWPWPRRAAARPCPSAGPSSPRSPRRRRSCRSGWARPAGRAPTTRDEPDDAEHQDPRGALLPGGAPRCFRARQEPVRHGWSPVRTDPRRTARCRSPASWCPTR